MLLFCDPPFLNFSRYPKLGTQHPESNSAGNDVFAKFSAFIKNTKKDANESEYLCVPAFCVYILGLLCGCLKDGGNSNSFLRGS
jgi:hypothetical protein